MADRVPTAVRIPADLHEILTKEAGRRDVSVNKVVEWALRRGLPLLAPLPDESPGFKASGNSPG